MVEIQPFTGGQLAQRIAEMYPEIEKPNCMARVCILQLRQARCDYIKSQSSDDSTEIVNQLTENGIRLIRSQKDK